MRSISFDILCMLLSIPSYSSNSCMALSMSSLTELTFLPFFVWWQWWWWWFVAVVVVVVMAVDEEEAKHSQDGGD